MSSVDLTKKFLEDVYVKRKMSTWGVEKQFGISRSRVFAYLKRYEIPTRNIAQSHIRYARADFSGDQCEKAYLLGFSIGDLRVRNLNGPRSETISIGCGSTRSAQIKLIKNLFSKYGRVWVSAPGRRGVVNIEAFVNRSFVFLLPGARKYAWCDKNEQYFFSFLAGFTDAEGSFFTYKGKAFVAWGNYDTEILNFIRNGLSKFGIEPPGMYCDSLRGYVDSQGYIRNKNYCHVTLTKGHEVKKLLNKLDSFVLHSEKRQALMRLRKKLALR